jgi:ankyrin repeat protein
MAGYVQGQTTLHKAAEGGNLTSVKYLVEKGTDVNMKDKDGITPLFFAASSGNLEVVKYLVEKGANVNAIDNNGTTPIYYSVSGGNVDIIKYLVEKGANINSKGRESPGYLYSGKDETLLFNAIRKCKLEIIKYLIEKGADVHIKDKKGRTPLDVANSDTVKNFIREAKTSLFYAARNGNLEVVKNIVENGANVNEKNSDGSGGRQKLDHCIRCKFEIL